MEGTQYTQDNVQGRYVRMYSHIAVGGSQFGSIPATSILVSNRTLVVAGHAVYMGVRYVYMYIHVKALVYNHTYGMYCTYYAACRCR